MARGNNRNTNIGVGLDTSGIAEGVQQVTGALRGLTAEIRKISEQGKQAAEPLAQSFENVEDTSGLAGAGVMAMAGIISDANYGIRGIANNLQQFSGLMVTLVTQTGSVAAAFTSLWSAMMGPLGIMLAFTTGIALLERFGMQSDKTKKETETLTTTYSDQAAEAMLLFGSLSNLIETNADLSKTKQAAEQINKQYNLSLNAETLTLDQLNLAYKNVLQSIKAKTALQASEEAISKGVKAENDAEIQLIKLEAERTKLVEKRSLLNQAITSQAEKADILTAKILALETKIAEQQAKKQEAINQQNIGLFAGQQAAEKIARLTQETQNLATANAPKKGVFEQLVMSSKTNLSELQGLVTVALDEFRRLPNELQPIMLSANQILDSGLMRAQKLYYQHINQLNQTVERFVESSMVGLFDALGASLVDGGDSIKQFGQNLLAEFGSFLQKMGGMIMAYGIGMEAFKKAFSNPIAAIAAGAALIAIGGAIKAAHKKKFGHGESAMGGATSYVPSSSGYGGQGNEVYIYSRLDGRDIILSSERSGYIMRR